MTECRQRLFAIFDRQYTACFKRTAKDECRESVKYILGRNIVHGDALTLLTMDRVPRPIIFSEWSAPFHNSLIKRRDFIFSNLIETSKSGQNTLFLHEEYSDLGKLAFLPKEVMSWPVIHFLIETRAIQ